MLSEYLLILLQALVINICLFCADKYFKSVDTLASSLLWSIDTTTTRTKQKTLKEFKYVTFVVIVNSVLGVVAGFLLIPIGKEQEYDFAIFFFRNYMPSSRYVLELMHFLRFPVISYMMVTSASILAYYTCHVKSQLYLLADVISYITNDFVGFLDYDLIRNRQYQEIVRRREKFLIERHVDLLR